MTAEPAYRWWRDPTTPQGDSWWGSTQTTTTIGNQIALLQQLGVRSYRIEIPWIFVAPDLPGGTGYSSQAAQDPSWPGYHWSRLDLIVQLLAQAGIEILPQVVYTPNWASGITATTSGGPNSPPTSNSYYADFLTALATRYHASVHSWELWNEPDLHNTWSGTMIQYVATILQPGYQAVKAVDPCATIVLGGLYNAGNLASVYQAGGKDYFDVANIHNYPSQPDWNQAQSAVNVAKHTMQQNGDANKPLWITEIGIMTSPSGSFADTTPLGQAQMVMDIYAHVTTPRIYWYQLADNYVYGMDGVVIKEEFFGLVSRDLATQKSSLAAYQTVTTDPPTNTPPQPTCPPSAAPIAGGLATLTPSSDASTILRASRLMDHWGLRRGTATTTTDTKGGNNSTYTGG